MSFASAHVNPLNTLGMEDKIRRIKAYEHKQSRNNNDAARDRTCPMNDIRIKELEDTIREYENKDKE